MLPVGRLAETRGSDSVISLCVLSFSLLTGILQVMDIITHDSQPTSLTKMSLGRFDWYGLVPIAILYNQLLCQRAEYSDQAWIMSAQCT